MLLCLKDESLRVWNSDVGIMQLNDKFKKYLEEAIGLENARVAFSAFEHPASVSVRINPFKADGSYGGEPVEWNRYGRMIGERPVFTLDPLFHAGAYYVQDSSSMFTGHVFRELSSQYPRPDGRPLRVLDLCAAPGGKTTDVAASLREMCGDNFLLVANEVMKSRVGILSDNVVLWGDPNVVVTSLDPAAFAAFPGFFDVIIADVPCSGEGMFRKDEQAQLQWSEDNVALCEARQRRIVADVWPALAQGGVFIYSTCTFNRRENDGNVEWMCAELGAEALLQGDFLPTMQGVLKTGFGYSLVPGHVRGEGQYCSAVRNVSAADVYVERSGRRAKSDAISKDQKPVIPDNVSDMFSTAVRFRMKGGLIIAVPEVIWSDVTTLESRVPVVSAGCAAGTVKGKDFVPDADLALSLILKDEIYPSVELGLEEALSFLHRDALVLQEMPKGYIIVRYKGVALGFVKNLGNRCNNLHPQSRRIRMDVKKSI